MAEELIAAACDGDVPKLRELIGKGANIHAMDEYRETPLLWAAYHGHVDAVRYLVDKGADVNATSMSGSTPLHWAVNNGHVDAFRYLVEKGANIHAKNDGGRTPLHGAAEEGHVDAVRYLVEKGANMEAKNKDGETAMDLAKDDATRDALRDAAIISMNSGYVASEADLERLRRLHTAATTSLELARQVFHEAQQNEARLAAALATAEAQVLEAQRAAAAAEAAKHRGLTAAVLDEQAMAPPVVVGHVYVERCTGGFAQSRVIGAGNFGTVYRAVDAALGVRFAVKRLHLACGPDAQRCADREVKLLERYRHPNIIRLLGYMEEGDGQEPRCVLYELAERGGLDSHLKPGEDSSRAAALTWRLRLRAAAGLARALAFLHRSQTLPAFHRDVKAANVALTADYTPKLIDGGLSKLFSEEDLAALTRGGASVAAPGYGVFFGTQGYRCPRIRGKRGIHGEERGVLFRRRAPGATHWPAQRDGAPSSTRSWRTGCAILPNRSGSAVSRA